MLTIASVILAAARLETEFDLSDFLNEDMDVMEGRHNLYESYDAAGWKPIYILMEPNEGSHSSHDDAHFLNSLRVQDTWLESTNGVVSPHSTGQNKHPAYDGPYPILFEAVEGDSSSRSSEAVFANCNSFRCRNSTMPKHVVTLAVPCDQYEVLRRSCGKELLRASLFRLESVFRAS